MRIPPATSVRPLIPLVLVAHLALVAQLALGGPALGAVSGHAEPAFTKTAGNNSYWWTWTAVDGVDSSGRTDYTYYLCFDTYRNGVRVEASNGTNGPGSQNCTNSLRSGPTPASGTFGAVPFSTATVLDDGANYQMCASGYYLNPFIWRSDTVNTNSCPASTIDRNQPQVSASIDGGAAFTRGPAIALHLDYSDPTSPPWFGADGRASNWVCIVPSTPCTPGGTRDPNCSVPNLSNSRINSFDCQANLGSVSDGTWYFCAYSADAAVPDNPTGPNQFIHALSNNANISATSCDAIVLDRGAPQVTASASETTVNVGTLVNLSASATDALSGVSGQFTWDYGDNTPQGGGANTTHTYTQAGTYVARASTSDGAGNGGSGTVTVTVNAAPGGGNTGGENPGSGTPGGGTVEGTTGATPLPQPIAPGTVSDQAGGGGTQTTTIAGLAVVAPKRINLRRTRRLLLALTSDSGGRVDVALLRGSRVVSRKGATLGGAGTYSLRLRLSRRLRNGRYTIRVSFTPTGATRAVTRTLRVRLVGAKRKRRGRRSGSTGAVRGTVGGVPGTRGASARPGPIVIR